jgi:hypothetical protein
VRRDKKLKNLSPLPPFSLWFISHCTTKKIAGIATTTNGRTPCTDRIASRKQLRTKESRKTSRPAQIPVDIPA